MKDSNLTWHYAKPLMLALMLAWFLLAAVIVYCLLTRQGFLIMNGLLFLQVAVLGLLFLTYNFFRNPERSCAGDDKALVSPADGKVVAIEELEEPLFLKRRMKRVAIFLSVFDVHVNRSPIRGRATEREHRPGKFLNAMDPKCSEENESQIWIIEDGEFKVAVRQVAGLIARRIVNWRDKGDTLERGDRIGLIKFGSRTELYVPLDCEVRVKVGDRVKGGETILATRP